MSVNDIMMRAVIWLVELIHVFHLNLVFQQTVHNQAYILVHCNDVKVFLHQPQLIVDCEGGLLKRHPLSLAHQKLLERSDVPLYGASC